MPSNVSQPDLIAEVYERYRHLDVFLSSDQDQKRNVAIQETILRECWLAVKQAHDARVKAER